MTDEFSNRQSMHLAVLAFLKKDSNPQIWMNQPPAAFTAKAEALRIAVDQLGEFIRKQETQIKGFSQEKEREEQDVETLAHEIGSALVTYYLDGGREAEAGAVNLSLSGWHRLREASLLEKARLVLERLGAAVASDPSGTLGYGLDAGDMDQLNREILEYQEIIQSPQAARSTRKALTAALRPQFREVNELLAGMDRLVLRFRKTPEGTQFAAGWKNARQIRDLGKGPAPAKPPAP